MKDYMVAHTFKSEEHRTKHFEASSQLTLEYMREHMKSDSASFQMNWGNPDEMVTYCWWKAESPAAILSMLGEMAELGEHAEDAHREAGELTASAAAGLVAIGRWADVTAEAARAAGLKAVESVPDVRSAVDVLRDWVQPGDVVLLKASRAAKLEQILDLF